MLAIIIGTMEGYNGPDPDSGRPFAALLTP